MLNTTKAFIFSLFELFIVYIVLGNFLGWSGGAIAMTGYQVDWQNSYIGFESFNFALMDFDNIRSVNWFFMSLSNIVDWLRELLDSMTFGIFGLITRLLNGTSLTYVDWLVWFIKFFVNPLAVTLYVILLTGAFASYFISFVVIFFRFCGGVYNVYGSSTSDVWSQWSYLSSEWDWSSILQSPIV